jgi:hypothetical protein
MYDRNGLELTPQADTMNTYKLTTVELNKRKYGAYARARETRNGEWTMFKIGYFADPRDAAYIAQKFAEEFDQDRVRQLVTDRQFDEMAALFVATTEIPEWKYPAEGMLIEDILNDYGYKRNRVLDAREALVEAIKLFGKRAPALNMVKDYIARVDQLYKAGKSYREAAREVVAAF